MDSYLDIDSIIDSHNFKNIKKIDNIDLDNIPRNILKIGVYIIILYSGDRYIGSSVDIFKRISDHRRYCKESIKNIKVYITKNEIQARNIERFLIGRINPELNYYLRTNRCIIRRKTFRTTLREETHKLIMDVQKDLYNIYGIRMSMKEIIRFAIPDLEESIKKIVGSLRNAETSEANRLK